MKDPVTGLPNRAALHHQLGREIRRARQTSSPLAVLVIDLDRFTEVNALFGRAGGDALLRQVAERLRSRAGDRLIASLGEDKFALALPASDGHAAASVARDLRESLRARHFVIADQHVEIEASVGVALFPEHAADLDTLLRHADLAMYAAKRSGAGLALYEAESDAPETSPLRLVADLRHAIARDELLLHYQPIVSVSTGRAIAMEALLRWRHPRRGLLPPGEFMPPVESTGFMRELSRWVLERSLAECVACRHFSPLRVSVNLSARDVLDADLPMSLRAALERNAADPEWLTVEVTETALMARPREARENLGRVRELGVRVAVDDFGTGYSSLAYLRQLPVDVLKIDRAFVRDLVSDPKGRPIVRAVVDLGHSLGLEVVAEGVEDGRTWELLASCGCDAVQGYHVARPMGAMDLELWLRARSARPGVQRDLRGADLCA